MHRKIYLICLILCMTIICGCSSGKSDLKAKNTTDSIEVNDTNGTTQDEINEETITANDKENKPDEERFFKDLTENQCNTLSFDGTTDTITIPIEKMTLDKAKEDEDIYSAYCTLELKNEYYEGKVSYCLNYEYYDVGGWQLNDCVEESRFIASISPDDEIIQKYIRNVCRTEGWNEPEILTLSNYEYVSQEKDYT